MFKNIFITGLVLSYFFSLNAQTRLDQYIAVGLSNNLAVQEKNLSLEKAMNALKAARSMYLPSLKFDMLFSDASGGRSIDLPIGDMLNPVYSTLNQIMQTQAFPSVPNQSINFLPRNYYDMHIRAVVPVLNTDIMHNKAVKSNMLKIHEFELLIYKRELVKDIKVAYYNYLRALDAVTIFQNNLIRAKENQRVNQRLKEAGSGLPAYVLRANAEVAEAEANLSDAFLKSENAKHYFNTLLNRGPDELIELYKIDDNRDDEIHRIRGELDELVEREELNALSLQVDIQKSLVKMSKQVYVPKLNGFLDVGSQAERMRFNKHSQYYMIGVNMSFPIFEGNRNRLKIKENEISVATSQNQLLQAQQQLNLAISVAKNEVKNAFNKLQSSGKQFEAAQNYYNLIEKGYAEGVNTYIETIDARTQWTKAQMAKNIAYYDCLSAIAKLERETASYTLP